MDSLQDYRWLVSKEANSALAQTQKKLESEKNQMAKVLTDLRHSWGQDRSRLVVEQCQLRHRARKKFVNADILFFEKDALEMATDDRIARYKAERMGQVARVADVCCCIGGDLMGLAAYGQFDQVSGFDRDEKMVLLANANCQALDQKPAAKLDHFEELDLHAFDAVHIDPERRTSGRSTSGDQFSPKLAGIFERSKECQNLSIKIAPATRWQTPFSIPYERQWIGHSRECKQQVVWTGQLAKNPGCRTACRLDHDSHFEYSFPDEQLHSMRPSIATEIEQFIYEPHNVLLAANLENALAHERGLKKLAPN
ncbi:MAG: class I SAM-dependent methyltransferase, partial [Planctomycetota bacterium]